MHRRWITKASQTVCFSIQISSMSWSVYHLHVDIEYADDDDDCDCLLFSSSLYVEEEDGDDDCVLFLSSRYYAVR